jgi:receptor protein-tyrosine kinase
MSRIEDALRRARAAGTRDEAGTLRPELHAVDAPVVPSWQLDRLPIEDNAADVPLVRANAPEPAAPAPVPAPPAAPAFAGSSSILGLQSTPEAKPREPGVNGEATLEPLRYPARGLSPLFAEKLVVGGTAAQPSREQYRRLAATLHQNQQQNPGLRVVMIVSAAPGEGKTLTAANLALTLSESYGKRVLLVDADLRQPALHDLFQVSNAKGLVDGLQAGAEVRLPLIEYSPNLQVLPAGEPPADPMSLLISTRMREVLAEAARAFDWVIVDTPPVGFVPDAHLLGEMAHSAVLVIRAGRTPHDLISAAVNALGKERIAGVVLNGVAASELPEGSQRDGYGYRYAYATR